MFYISRPAIARGGGIHVSDLTFGDRPAHSNGGARRRGLLGRRLRHLSWRHARCSGVEEVVEGVQLRLALLELHELLESVVLAALEAEDVEAPLLGDPQLQLLHRRQHELILVQLLTGPGVDGQLGRLDEVCTRLLGCVSGRLRAFREPRLGRAALPERLLALRRNLGLATLHGLRCVELGGAVARRDARGPCRAHAGDTHL